MKRRTFLIAAAALLGGACTAPSPQKDAARFAARLDEALQGTDTATVLRLLGPGAAPQWRWAHEAFTRLPGCRRSFTLIDVEQRGDELLLRGELRHRIEEGDEDWLAEPVEVVLPARGRSSASVSSRFLATAVAMPWTYAPVCVLSAPEVILTGPEDWHAGMEAVLPQLAERIGQTAVGCGVAAQPRLVIHLQAPGSATYGTTPDGGVYCAVRAGEGWVQRCVINTALEDLPQLGGVVRHESAHALLARLSPSLAQSPPAWIVEGAAVWIQLEGDVVAQLRSHGQWPQPAAVDAAAQAQFDLPDFYAATSEGYALAGLFFAWLATELTPAGTLQAIHALYRDDGRTASLVSALGEQDVASVHRRWRDWVVTLS